MYLIYIYIYILIVLKNMYIYIYIDNLKSIYIYILCIYILHNATRVGRNPKLRAYNLLLSVAYSCVCNMYMYVPWRSGWRAPTSAYQIRNMSGGESGSRGGLRSGSQGGSQGGPRRGSRGGSSHIQGIPGEIIIHPKDPWGDHHTHRGRDNGRAEVTHQRRRVYPHHFNNNY